MKLSEELTWRGFVHQIAGPSLSDVVDGEKRTIYQGIDPSADSATVGNFVVWMLLWHLKNAGHKIVFLVGGGTGMIGDPKPDQERSLSTREEINERVQKIKEQARIIFKENVEFVDNHDWLGSLELIPFLRDVGKHFTVNELVKKDAIATRLSSEIGLSYTEFAYPLLQAYDYLELHRVYGCNVQVGGSDQWGNIVAGVDLIRRKTTEEVYAITVPLVIDKATGKKFGKSEGNAVWLAAEKTSPFAFYQFWLNSSDDSVIDFLKLYTTLEKSQIEQLELSVQQNPGAREAQRVLAESITTFVHGEAVTISVIEASTVLFGGAHINEVSDTTRKIIIDNAPLTKVANNTLLSEVLVEAGLASSKREARTFIEGNAVSVNGVKILEDNEINNHTGKYCVVQRGKKQLSVLEVG